MFAPQTNPASPAVLLSHKPKFMCVSSIRDVLPLPVNLFPVYRWVFAVSKMLNFVTLGCCSDASRVGQRPQRFYQIDKAIRPHSQRILATGSRSCKAVLEGRGFYPNFR
jgi:hypothetical protein